MDLEKTPTSWSSIIQEERDIDGVGTQRGTRSAYSIVGRSTEIIQTSLLWFEVITHLAAISSTSVLILINIMELYWMDTELKSKWKTANILVVRYILSPDARLNYIQFAAKLHELLMMSSLSCILLHDFHRRLTNHGFPLGLLDAPYLVGAGGGISLLWKPRFWACCSRGNKGLGLLYLLFTILTITLGPSSAIAMAPSLSWWPIRDPYDGQNLRVYLTSPGADPWPTKGIEDRWSIEHACYDVITSSDPYCPAAGWSTIKDSLISLSTVGSSTNATIIEPLSNSLRLLTSEPIEDDVLISRRFYTKPSRRVSTATTAINAVVLGFFWRYTQTHDIGRVHSAAAPLFKSTLESSVRQPVVYSQCYSVLANATGSNYTPPMELRAPWNGYDNRASNWWGLLDDDAILHGLPSREPRFQWISVDTLSALSVTILPIELKDRTDLEGEQESLITLCSFDARWAKATIQLDPRSSSLIQSSISATGSLYNKKKSEADIRMAHDISAQVILPSNFLDALNPISNSPKKNMSSITSFLMETTKITNRNNTHFNIRMDAIPQYGTASFTKYCRDVEDLIGTATGALIADGMARYTYTSLKPWLELRSSTLADGFEYIDLLDANLTGYPQNTSTTFGNSTKEKAYFIEFTASRYGYSYGFISADRSVQVAVCSICIYVFIIVIYLGAMLARRIFGQYRTSSAWDNISSIVDLALNSVVPPYVVDMGAVHTAASGRQRAQNCNDLLKAREFNGNRVGLEKSNSDEGSGEKIIPGKKY